MRKTAFFARRWFRYAAALFTTLFAAFCLSLGPLFLFGVVKSADGRPTTDAGIALTIMAVPFTAVALFSWFIIFVLRKPLLVLCREGVIAHLVAPSSLDNAPFIPGLVRIAFLIISQQGFKQTIALIPWLELRGIHVGGMPMARHIVIEGSVTYFPASCGVQLNNEMIAFGQAELADNLDRIADAIQFYWNDSGARSGLRGLPTG